MNSLLLGSEEQIYKLATVKRRCFNHEASYFVELSDVINHTILSTSSPLQHGFVGLYMMCGT